MARRQQIVMSYCCCLLLVVALIAVASSSAHRHHHYPVYPDWQQIHHRVRRGDFYGPGGIGPGGGAGNGYGGGAGFGFSGSSFNPVLFQGAAVAGGFAKEAYNANLATDLGSNGLLSGGTFGVGYYASSIANAAAAGAGSGGGKGGLTYG